jgi:hypothetical protein
MTVFFPHSGKPKSLLGAGGPSGGGAIVSPAVPEKHDAQRWRARRESPVPYRLLEDILVKSRLPVALEGERAPVVAPRYRM